MDGGGIESLAGNMIQEALASLGGDKSNMMGMIQMMVGMVDAQLGAMPPTMVYEVLQMARLMLDQLLAKYAPQPGVIEAGPQNADQ